MKEVLITVQYTDPTDKFWWDCSIKNKIVCYDPEKQTIHEVIKDLCEERDGMELTYKGKPRGNVYCDTDDGDSVMIGYVYRGKCVVDDRSMTKPVRVYWDVWVTIKGITEFEFENIDG